MPLNIDGAGRSKSLACLPTARGTVAPTRGQVPGGVLLGTSLIKSLNLEPEVLGGLWLIFSRVHPGGVWGVQASLGASRASRGLRASESSRHLGPSRHLLLLTPLKDFASGPGFHKPAGASTPSGLATSLLSLSEPSAYTNEKMLLLTKMDLTEFRSETLKGKGLGGLPPGRRGVGDCVRWPSTFRPWRHLARSHALEGSLTPAHHILHGNMTANPKP